MKHRKGRSKKREELNINDISINNRCLIFNEKYREERLDDYELKRHMFKLHSIKFGPRHLVHNRETEVRD